MLLRTLVLTAVVTLAATGCGGKKIVASSPEDPGLLHVHGLGVDPGDGSLYLATHTGLFRSAQGEKRATRVGDSFQDTMGFTVSGPGRFLGSGHPDARTGQPPLLGLIESTDAGNSWHPVSLSGKADLHVLRTAGTSVVGYDGITNRLLRFGEKSAATTELSTPKGTLVDFAVDPADERQYLASTGTGLFRSRNGGRSWSQVDRRRAGLLVFRGPGKALLVRGDGVVEQSTSGGRSWKAVGSIDGAPAALSAHKSDVFVAMQDGPILQSSDGGATWTVRVRA